MGLAIGLEACLHEASELAAFILSAHLDSLGKHQPSIDGKVYHFHEIANLRAEAKGIVEQLTRLYFFQAKPQQFSGSLLNLRTLLNHNCYHFALVWRRERSGRYETLRHRACLGGRQTWLARLGRNSLDLS